MLWKQTSVIRSGRGGQRAPHIAAAPSVPIQSSRRLIQEFRRFRDAFPAFRLRSNRDQRSQECAGHGVTRGIIATLKLAAGEVRWPSPCVREHFAISTAERATSDPAIPLDPRIFGDCLRRKLDTAFGKSRESSQYARGRSRKSKIALGKTCKSSLAMVPGIKRTLVPRLARARECNWNFFNIPAQCIDSVL